MTKNQLLFFSFLGVALDTELTYRVLYEDTINRANKPLGLILRMMRDFNDPKQSQQYMLVLLGLSLNLHKLFGLLMQMYG